MKIIKVDVKLLTLPLGKRIKDSIHDFDSIGVVLVRVRTDKDVEGIGFTYTINTRGEGIKSIIKKDLVNLILNKSLEDEKSIEKSWEKMFYLTHDVYRGSASGHAISAIDIALWDALAKGESKPLYHLLGAKSEKAPIYDTDCGWLHFSLEELLKNCSNSLKIGYKGVKIKVGKEEAKEDFERVKAVRDLVGGKALLMIDANQKFSLQEALYRGREFEKYELYWYEEPLIADDLIDHIKLKRYLKIPIALGETLTTPQEFKNFVQSEALSFIQPDVCRCFGITGFLKIARLAEQSHINVAPHGVPELHVQLACSLENVIIIEHTPLLSRLFKDRLEFKEGFLYPPKKDGHGLEIDEELIRA